MNWNGRSPAIPFNFLVNARKVALSGSTMAAEIAPAVDGLVSMDGTVESGGTNLEAKGNGEFAQLRLAGAVAPTPEPLHVNIALAYDFAIRSGTLSRCDATLPKGAAGIHGTYTVDDGVVAVKLKFRSPGCCRRREFRYRPARHCRVGWRSSIWRSTAI